MSDQPQRRIINVDEAEYMERGHGDTYQAALAMLAPHVGAQQLGFNVTRLAAGKAAFPYHLHHNNEEMFVVLEGSGTVRLPDGEHPLRQGDVLSCPAGPAGAHKIVNDSDADLVYLAISTTRSPEIVEYPDSNKVSAVAGKFPDKILLRKIFRADSDVDYWDGEE